MKRILKKIKNEIHYYKKNTLISGVPKWIRGNVFGISGELLESEETFLELEEMFMESEETRLESEETFLE